jgi:hypothetical protein
MLRPGSEPASIPAGESFLRPPAGAPEGLGLRLFNHPTRVACTVLSIGYFGLLWLSDGWLLPLIMGFLYVFLTLPRWRDLGFGEFFSLAVLPQPFYLLLEGMHGPFGVPLLAHFAVVAPAVFLCITPLGVTLPRFNGKAGRSSFILFALPFFLLLGSQHWPELDRVLSLIWSILWLPTEKVTFEGLGVASIFMFFRLWARLADIGVSQRVGYVILAAFGLDFILGDTEPISAYAPAMDLALATGIFMLCVWPGSPVADKNAEP